MSTLTTSSPAATKRALTVIFFIMLMDIVGLSILSPIAPFVVQRYSNDALNVTLLTVIYAAAQFLAAPFLGKLSDRIGRRPVLVWSVIGSALGYFLFGVGGALWVLFLSRLIDGLTGGNLSTAMAYIADVSSPEERAKNFILVGMSYGLGFVLGPALSSLLSPISVEAPMFAAAGLALLQAVAAIFFLPESLPAGRREHGQLNLGDLNPFGAIGQMARKPGLAWLFTIEALFNFAFNGVVAILGVYVVQKYGVEPWQLGLFFVVSGIANIIVQSSLARFLTPRLGEKNLSILSLLGQALCNIAFVFTTSVGWLYPLSLVRQGVTSFIWGALGALISNKVSDREQGILAGVNAALSSLMAVIGPLWAGAMYDHVSPESTLIASAVILLLAALMLTTVKATTLQSVDSVPVAHPNA